MLSPGTYPSGYVFQREMANGFIGKTHLATEISTRKSVIIKIIDITTYGLERAQYLMERIDHIQSLQSPFVVPYTSCSLTSDNKVLLLIRPYIEFPPLAISIHSLLKKKSDNMNRIFAYWKIIVRTIFHMHQHHIFPSFIKPNNIFITDQGKVLITDLYPPPIDIDVMVHSPNAFDIGFLAPEFFVQRAPPQHQADVWSLGILLLYMVTGSLPWSNKNVFTMLNQIVACKVVPVKPVPRVVAVYSSKLLVFDPDQRIPLDKVITDEVQTANNETVHLPHSSTNQCTFMLQNNNNNEDNNNNNDNNSFNEVNISHNNNEEMPKKTIKHKVTIIVNTSESAKGASVSSGLRLPLEKAKNTAMSNAGFRILQRPKVIAQCVKTQANSRPLESEVEKVSPNCIVRCRMADSNNKLPAIYEVAAK